tara:strand:+ start:80 stop:307 length:228 start_codon:yes stop_codon:yes gene_type:complete
MDVKDYLKNNKINFVTFKHPPFYTCGEAEQYNQDIKGIHAKNLFLKEKRSRRFYLLIAPAKKKMDVMGGNLELNH